MQQNFASFILLHFARWCSNTPQVWQGFCCKYLGEYNGERIL